MIIRLKAEILVMQKSMKKLHDKHVIEVEEAAK